MAQVEAGRLEIDKVVPHFTLPSLEGGQVSIRDFRQKCNLVIAYLDPNHCEDCANLLREFADNYNVYQSLETQVLAVCPGSPSDLQGKVGNMGLPFPVLSDQWGEVGRIYLADCPDAMAAIFVTDRYGALRTAMSARSADELPNQQSIFDWLSLIESECPECGT